MQILAGPTFIGVFSVSGVLFGIAADHYNRLRLLGGAVMVYSGAIILTSVSQQYWHLVMARMLLAAGWVHILQTVLGLMSNVQYCNYFLSL